MALPRAIKFAVAGDHELMQAHYIEGADRTLRQWLTLVPGATITTLDAPLDPTLLDRSLTRPTLDIVDAARVPPQTRHYRLPDGLGSGTTPIPGVNDAAGAIAAMAEQVAGLGLHTPWHLRRFHPDHERRSTAPTPSETLAAAVGIAAAQELRHVHVERALGPEGCSCLTFIGTEGTARPAARLCCADSSGAWSRWRWRTVAARRFQAAGAATATTRLPLWRKVGPACWLFTTPCPDTTDDDGSIACEHLPSSFGIYPTTSNPATGVTPSWMITTAWRP